MHIRPAQAGDQETIRQIIHAARLNPMGLDWQHFVIAEENGKVVGVGQIKPHKDGSRELASVAIIPEWQKRGVGSTIIRTLLEQDREPSRREPGPLYLMCRGELASFYARFGFHPLAVAEMPPYFRRIQRVTSLMMPLVGRHSKPLIMKREQPAQRAEESHGK